MTRRIFIAAALALAATLPVAPAQAAGAARTFVSAAGSDTNNCTNVATPCRHLAAAYAATAADGEIFILDPANYGSLTITRGLSIEGHGWASIAPVSGQAAIIVNANSSDKINIIGVVLDGTGVANTTGIDFVSGGSLNVRDSVVRNFAGGGSFGDGILVQTTGSSQVTISNTLVSDNANAGIYLTPVFSGTLNASVDHVTADHNKYGIFVDSATTTGQLIFAITDSHADGNNNVGIVLNSGTGGANSGIVKNTTANNNVAADGIQVSGQRTTVLLTHSVMSINGGSAVNITSGATVFSDGTNTNFLGPVSSGVQSQPPF